MKVVHVVRQFAPSVGGLEEAVLKLCITLRTSGVDAAVVTLDRVRHDAPGSLPASAAVDGVPVTRIPFRGSWRYPLAPGVLSHIKDADVVHVHAIDFFFDFLAATKRLHGKPLVASTHGGFFHTDFARRLKQLYFQSMTRASARRYDAIFASSQSDLGLFRTISPNNVALVENGVDVSKWQNRAASRPSRTMIAIGRFSSNKQLPKLLPTLQCLRRLHPAWSLIIAGRDSDLTGDGLVRCATEAGLCGAVEVLTGRSDGALAEAIGAASYIVSASRYEGFGIGIVEGLSAGLMPVLNRIPPFASLVADTGCGLLVDIDDPLGTAKAIEDAHQAIMHTESDVRSLQMEAARRYSWDGAASIVAGHYRAAFDRAA